MLNRTFLTNDFGQKFKFSSFGRKIGHFPKGLVNPQIWSKNIFFILCLIATIGIEIRFGDVLERKEVLVDHKISYFQIDGKSDIFYRG